MASSIRWALGGVVFVGAVTAALLASAATGDVVVRTRSATVDPNAPQRALLGSALMSCLPGVSAADVSEFVCRRDPVTNVKRCRAEGETTVNIATYLLRRLEGTAQPATSRSGTDVTYPHVTPWSPVTQECVIDLVNYVASAHAGIAASTLVYIRAWRDGGIHSYVETMELVAPQTYVDAEIAGTAEPIAGIAE